MIINNKTAMSTSLCHRK